MNTSMYALVRFSFTPLLGVVIATAKSAPAEEVRGGTTSMRWSG